MAHSSWKVFSSSRTSRTDDPDEVLFMLDEIPTDNESTTEEEPDSEPDNAAPEIDSEESEDSSTEPSDGEPHETTSEGPSTSGTKKKTAAQVAAEKVTAQIRSLEGMLSKTGMDANKLTQDQIKKMQADLGQMGSGPKDKLTVAQVRSLLEVAQRKWRKREEPAKEHAFDFPEGIYSVHAQ